MEFGGVPKFAYVISEDDSYWNFDENREDSCHLNALGTDTKTALVFKHIPQNHYHHILSRVC